MLSDTDTPYMYMYIVQTMFTWLIKLKQILHSFHKNIDQDISNKMQTCPKQVNKTLIHFRCYIVLHSGQAGKESTCDPTLFC